MKLHIQFALRLLMCQALGTIAAMFVDFAAAPIWAPVYANDDFMSVFPVLLLECGFALAFGMPFYFLVILIFLMLHRLILERPFVWSVLIPGCLLVAGFIAFPPSFWRGIFWVNIILLSAFFSGLIFYFWQWRSPLLAPHRGGS